MRTYEKGERKKKKKKNRKVKDMIEAETGRQIFGKMREQKLVRRRREEDKRVEGEEEKKWESFAVAEFCGCTHGAEQTSVLCCSEE